MKTMNKPVEKAAWEFANFLRSKGTPYVAVGHGTLDGEDVLYLYSEEDEVDGWTGTFGGYGVIGEKVSESSDWEALI
jgi:hypothetical protein